MPQHDGPDGGCVVVIGGTSGLGRDVAEYYAKRGREVVVTGRDTARTEAVAAEIGGRTTGVAVDLAKPDSIAAALAGIGEIEHLVLSAFVRDVNKVSDYQIDRAVSLVTVKLVGYTEVAHTLAGRLSPTGSVLLFGGGSKDRPFPGSATVSTVNAGVVGLVNVLASELRPVRVNALHPGIVADSPFWAKQPAQVHETYRGRTPTGRLTTMADVTDAAVFLLENPSVNAVNLDLNGGAGLG
ncbi:SDR family oxidoreductase [Micromonospora sp. WMMD1102]|uniref:SDR family NAD(P)-dependent oxidoreductase n=1 Tax=Micromonospora sp. WMMD1102 TaxID=3016105 RepID=UPI002415181E|nr:SDR family oxidoreductase [Micromonospora sp. WMMD1102]MDG4789913.1 SDR family oxidoreductase [Micromonospora sp. WMMD1102]